MTIVPNVRVVRPLHVSPPVVSVVSVIGMSPIDVTLTGGLYRYETIAQ